MQIGKIHLHDIHGMAKCILGVMRADKLFLGRKRGKVVLSYVQGICS